MIVKQLTVFVENKQGRLVKITDLLANCGVNMRALSIGDTQEFGLLRLIVDKPDTAVEALRKEGYLVRSNDIISVKIADKPGGLSSALNVLSNAGINVEYIYAYLAGREENACVALRVSDNEKAVKALSAAGYTSID